MRTIRNVEKIEMIDFESYQKLKQCQSQRNNNGFDKYEEDETAGHPSEGFDFESLNVREVFGRAAEVMKRVLTDHEKTVIQLRFHLDYSFERIAEFLGVTLSAAQSSCERALRKIRAEMSTFDTLR